MRWLRRLCTYALFWLAVPFLAAHPKIRRGFRRRLGLHPRGWPQAASAPRVWLHGASAGDVLALAPLARELKASSELSVVASTITNSGHVMAARQRNVFDGITYLPYDLPGAVRRTLACINPKVLVLEYTELWPELIDSAARGGVRLVLHNGRINAERLSSYRWLFALTGNLLSRFDLLLMRDEYEAERAVRLGAPATRVHVTGNTKFDNLNIEVSASRLAELRAALAVEEGARVWVCGSTHEGEEDLLLGVFAELKKTYPDLRMVVAPRYVERAERIVATATRRGLSARLRSSAPTPLDVVVLDSIGELTTCYALATLVFVGGSFVSRGGQNILEPAACGRPVLFGPSMKNFADAVLVLLGRGGVQVASPEQLLRVMSDLLGRASYRDELGELARSQVLAVRGAARKNAELILPLVGV